METAVGNMGGMPNIMERMMGAIMPTASPHGQPHTMPHRNTGMCMGLSILPMVGIWPVRNGSTNANARNSAE